MDTNLHAIKNYIADNGIGKFIYSDWLESIADRLDINMDDIDILDDDTRDDLRDAVREELDNYKTFSDMFVFLCVRVNDVKSICEIDKNLSYIDRILFFNFTGMRHGLFGCVVNQRGIVLSSGKLEIKARQNGLMVSKAGNEYPLGWFRNRKIIRKATV